MSPEMQRMFDDEVDQIVQRKSNVDKASTKMAKFIANEIKNNPEFIMEIAYKYGVSYDNLDDRTKSQYATLLFEYPRNLLRDPLWKAVGRKSR